MFLHVSVILSTGGVTGKHPSSRQIPPWADILLGIHVLCRHPLTGRHPWADNLPDRQTPPSRQTPPWADTPQQADIPLDRQPPGRQMPPSKQTLPWQTPPWQADTPLGQTPLPPETVTAGDVMHPTGMHSCFHCYASYWNAFLFSLSPALCVIVLVGISKISVLCENTG